MKKSKDTDEQIAFALKQAETVTPVTEVMQRVALSRGAPLGIRVDNGPAFISKALDLWAYEHGVSLDFSRPGSSVRVKVARTRRAVHGPRLSFPFGRNAV